MTTTVSVHSKTVNIKCSYRFPYTNKSTSVNYFHNYKITKTQKSFSVIRSANSSYVFIYFPPSHINVTGIRNDSELANVQSHIKCLFRVSGVVTLNIDNITSKLYIKCSVPQFFLPKIADFITSRKKTYGVKSVHFDADRFSSLFIRFNSKKYGCILLFKSKKAMLVGCKTNQAVLISSGILRLILSSFYQ